MRLSTLENGGSSGRVSEVFIDRTIRFPHRTQEFTLGEHDDSLAKDETAVEAPAFELSRP